MKTFAWGVAWLLVGLFGAVKAQATYDVGPGQPLATIAEVDWTALGPGDTVRIHWRATPYREKFVICRQGTAGNPITVSGVPDPSTGALPVISGDAATTVSGLNYWNENRGVIKIGGANTPPDTTPMHIVVENLEIRSARPGFTFTDDGGNAGTAYASNASAIYIEKGQHITVRNCTLTDCGNGFFVAADNGNTQDILVEYCYIHGNGIDGSIFEHNAYTEAFNITYQFNRFGPLRANCLGNNLKDRSAGTIVRFNWIESGNRQLDLVESDYAALYNATEYRSTFVYGNVLIEPDGAGNSQIIHYGGDSGDTSRYRKGTLFLYNNTIVSTRAGNTTLLRLSSDDETCDARNNIVFVSTTGTALALLDEFGTITLANNFFKPGYDNTHGSLSPGASVTDINAILGADPGFTDFAGNDFSLLDTADCRDAATILAGSALALNRHYLRHQASESRPSVSTLDVGAYEYSTAGVGNNGNGGGNGGGNNGGNNGGNGGGNTNAAGGGCQLTATGGSPLAALALLFAGLLAVRRRPLHALHQGARHGGQARPAVAGLTFRRRIIW